MDRQPPDPTNNPGIVSVVVVTWNSAQTIRLCLDSVFAQQGGWRVEVVLVDNASEDNTLDLVSDYPGVELLRLESNFGFCRANNLGIALCRGDYILLLNPDARIQPEYLSTLIPALEQNPQAAMATGKVLRMEIDGSPIIQGNNPIFDSTGIVLNRSRRAKDRGGDQQDTGQYNMPGEIFGVCAAVCLYKSVPLKAAALDGQVFDELFFAYREDVDLSWRLNILGWKAIYIPLPLAYHYRGWKSSLSRKSVPVQIRLHSYKNWRLLILKNETLKTFLPDAFHILGFELLALGYVILRERELLRAYRTILQNLGEINRWRRFIHRPGEVSLSKRLFRGQP